MPKFYCDYCEINLKNDSYNVRKQHNAGRKHKENVYKYYEEWVEDENQKRLDQTVQNYFTFKSCSMPKPNMFYPMQGMGFHGVPPPMYPMQGMNGAPPIYPPGPSPVSPGMSGAQAIQPGTNPGVYPPSMFPPVGVPLPAASSIPAIYPGMTGGNAAVSYPPPMCPPVGVPPPMTGVPSVQPTKNGMTSPPNNMNGTAEVPIAASNSIPFPPTMGGVAPFPPVSYPPIASAYGFQHTNYRYNYEQSQCAPYKRPDNHENNFHATGYNYNTVQ